MRQLTLNLRPRASLVAGKKLERLTVTCSAELRGLVERVCSITGESVSEMLHRHMIAGLQADIGTVFIAEPYGDKRLSDLMR